MKRHTSYQKGARLTQWQANKIKIVLAEWFLSPEYLLIVDKLKNKLKEELILS